MKRILLIVVGLGVVLGAALVIFLYTGLGAAIRAAVEGVGSRATQTEVNLAFASVSLTSGEGTLKGLVVKNPKGYSTPSAIELGEIHVRLDTSTVTSDTILINEIVIDGPELTYELGAGGSNIGVIQRNVDAFSGGSSGGGTSGDRKDKVPAKDGGGVKMIIEDLIVRNGRVNVSAGFLKGQKLGAGLGEIHLRNIGKSTGGATAAEVAKEVLGALTDSALDAVRGLNVSGLAGGVTETIGGAVESVKDIFGGKKKNK